MPLYSYSKFQYPHTNFLKIQTSNFISEHAALYLTHVFKSFSVSLLGVFLPIYIYNLALSSAHFSSNTLLNGISWILLYFFLRSFVALISMVFFVNILFGKLGFQRALILSVFLLALQLLCLKYASISIIYVIFAGILGGLEVTFYWVPYHIYFVRKMGGKSHKYGAQMGTRRFLVHTLTSISPFLGGLIISTFNFDILFVISLLLLLTSCIPLILSLTDTKHHYHHISSIFLSYLFNKKYYYSTIAYLGEGIESLVYTVFWPLLLFVILSNYLAIGTLHTISLFISGFVILFVGKYIDSHSIYKLHRVGIYTNSVFHLLRLLITSAPFAYLLDISDRLNSGMFAVPTMALLYEKAQRNNSSEYILYREFAIHLAIAVTAILLGIFIVATGYWRWVFTIGALASLLVLSIHFDSN
ncbi:MAG: hypothetical protein R3B92_01135 [Patescibacteria group bacterium]